jgi:hypothetical protein
MKKIFFVLILFFLFLHGYSQDLIIKTNGVEIKSKVIEVGLDSIKYKVFENPDGPLFSIARNDVSMVKYENGTKEIITAVSEPDDPTKEDDNEQKIENIATNTEGDLDYSDLLQDLDYYLKHPMNLNTASASDLEKLYMLNDIQISNLLTHIQKNGKLLSVYELQSIDGFDLATINSILPYVKVSNEGSDRFNFKDALQYSSHDLFIRYQRVIEEQAGYAPITDSALALSPNSRYLGSPDKLYFRYRYKFFDKISLGVTGEKDAGEQFFQGAQKYGFDFYSAHLMIGNIGILKKVIIGDYSAQFGQALTFWTGMGFGKSSDVINIKKLAQGIKPYTSVNEITFLRGAAVTLGLKGFELTAFYSRKKIDANVTGIDSLTNELEYISSIQETGIHSTPNEVADRHAMLEQIFGGHFGYHNRRLNVGITACQSIYGAELQKDLQLYNQFDFTGKSNFNMGVDYSYIFRNINFFGEASHSWNGGMAFLDGIMLSLDPHISVSVLYRNYQKNYQALYTSAFGEGSQNSNEEGIFTGVNVKFNPKWSLAAYCDFYNFNWLRYRVDAPSKGQDYMAELTFTPSKKISMYLKYRYEQKKENNTSADNVIDYPESILKHSLRFNLSYQVTASIALKSRVEYLIYHKGDDNPEHGYLIYQDIRYKPQKLPFALSFRYALFQTDSYNSRMYAYENDVLYSYSIPAYYYKGSRFYAMITLKLYRHLDLWLRYSITNYSNQTIVSSGLNEIQGNHKSEIKAQIRLKF